MAPITDIIFDFHGITSDESPNAEWLKYLDSIKTPGVKVIGINYNKHFDHSWRAKLRAYAFSLLLPLPSKVKKFLSGSLGDVFDLFLYPETREKVVTLTNRRIDYLISAFPNARIHFTAHSLGTLVAPLILQNKPRLLDSVTLFASPMSSTVRFIRATTRRFFSWEFLNLSRNSGDAEITYVYGTEDPISGPLDGPFLEAIDVEFSAETGHNDWKTLISKATQNPFGLGGLVQDV